MKDKLVNIVKTNHFIYAICSSILNLFLMILRLFIKVEDNIILMNSFGGKKYDDSPRVVFEYMKTQEKYKKYDIYWAFHDPDKFEVEGAKKVKTDTLKYFIIALKAKYWITNSSLERGLKFKNKKTIYINTWHGSVLKKGGRDLKKDLFKFNTSQCDVIYAQNEFDIEVMSRAYNIPKEKFVLIGFPRNDELFVTTNEEIEKIKEKLKISKEKKIILYAPTFRDFERDSNGCIMAPPITIEKWKEKLADKYIVLFRAHYEVNKILGIETDEFLINVSDYNNLNELMKISDVLISDYSSIIFDYSILERPIYCYAYDYDEYKEKRGLYMDINKELPNGICQTEDELLEKINNCNFEVEKEKSKELKKHFVMSDGNARKYIDKIIK